MLVFNLRVVVVAGVPHVHRAERVLSLPTVHFFADFHEKWHRILVKLTQLLFLGKFCKIDLRWK